MVEGLGEKMAAVKVLRGAGIGSVAVLAMLGGVCGMGAQQQQKAAIDYATPLMGTAPLDQRKLIGNAPPPGEALYSGFTLPGAVYPHSVVETYPVNQNLALHPNAGVPAEYYYPNPTMMGFSSGGPGGPIVMPVIGSWTAPPRRTPTGYDKKLETASPGYYSVTLDSKVHVELTATMWTGLERFTFPKTKDAHLLIDLDRVDGVVEVIGDHTVAGRTADGQTRNNEAPQDPFFVAEFSKPFTSFGTFRHMPGTQVVPAGGDDIHEGERKVSGRFAGAFLQFAMDDGGEVMMKVAHGRTPEEAQERLRREDPGWDFDAIHQRARAAWAERLGRIEVEGGTEKEKMIFYSCLEHAVVSPRLLAAKGEPYLGLDGKMYTADHDRYGPIPYWDTGRDQIVLLELMEPELQPDILASQLDESTERGYFLTSFHGDNAVFYFLGNWNRGTKFDYASAYDLLRKNAMDPRGPRRFLDEYMKNGWIADVYPNHNMNPSPPEAGGKAGVATTQEYAWDDYSLAQYARKLGKDDDARMFEERSHNYKNVFDPTIGFMRGKTADGKWISPFDPQEPYYNFMSKEGSGWSTLWLEPHDVAGLVNLLGGREKAAAKLDEFFTTPYTPKGICRDCTGMVGQYVQGNQPDWEAPFYYDWVGQPWKTQAVTRKIMAEMYGSDKSGYAFSGMDDQGSNAAWYVLSAMGFYPVDPGSPNYILGSPLFRDMKLHMGGGKTFEVVAENNSDANMYIQSATMNGQPWDKPWFSHSDIANGGKLVLKMGPKPNMKWGSAIGDAPPSMSEMK